MSVRQGLVVTLWSVAVSVFLPYAAMAQTAAAKSQASSNYCVTGYLNRNSGGTLFEDRVADPTVGYGAALTFAGRYVLSGEVDFNYNPQFFGAEDQWQRNNLLAFSVGALVGPTVTVGRVQRVRPYGCVGVGLVRSHIEASVDNSAQTDPLVEVGGGLFWFFRPAVGVRADVRYRWDTGDLSQRGGYIKTLNYVRGSFGLTVAF